MPRTIDSDSTVRAALNRLLGKPALTAANRVWVGNITYLPCQGGDWLYLAVWLDCCSRKVVGWAVRDTMPKDLVREALHRPLAWLVVHSDSRSQFMATNFKHMLARHALTQSTSWRGNCYDNALPGMSNSESFWSHLKAELLDGGSFPGMAEAKIEISHHVTHYYAERRHSALGYQTPNHLETQLQTTSQFYLA